MQKKFQKSTPRPRTNIKFLFVFPLQSLDKKVFMQLKYEKFIG